MSDFDAVVIGAGHNGLAAAMLLQQAGLRTVCLESKRYAGGMASTVELFDEYHFEIAGSVQFPTAPVVRQELGLDSLPTIDLDVMSVALRGVGDDPMVQYSDPIKLFTHLNEVHSADAVNGMAGLMAWAQAPTRALGRFEAGAPPKTLDEMYACATNEFERSAITEMLFGSVTDVLDRYLPDREKHGALRGSMTVLAVNTLYRGPATPGSAAALAFGLGVPDGDTMQMKKLRGGIGALTAHLSDALVGSGGEVRLRTKVTEILVDDGKVAGVRTEAGETLTAPIVISAIAPDVTVNDLIDAAALPADIRARYARIDHRGSYLQMHFALDEAPAFTAPYEALNDPSMQASIGIFCTPEEVQQQWEDCRRGIVPADPTVVLQIPSQNDPHLAPAGKHAASAFALWFPIEGNADYGQAKTEMGQRVIDKITRLAPNFADSISRHTTFTPKHMGVMFGAPGGDYCHGLFHSDQVGPNRPGPKGFLGQPLPIEGLYLGSAGCHGGPGITFIPGYNAGRAALAHA
ncbi:NAD(P)/FAD-dependent oxidoreductase [Mycobacterium sp. 1423905.2]|uniref:phytoene desaturase family protein n=1 Tax=Mycobacterium sp. 1423905.2 TaxID=1856859 RepID=UPI0007FC90B7|nr:NAD(P)/FAD-dependent oxidoreductase [Mycobacterium sp. 1423905.2]OBJ47966.1 dehydrogenase [Mycobacterium sp. 1423905.2]